MLKTQSDFEMVSFCVLYERKRRSKSHLRDKKSRFLQTYLQKKNGLPENTFPSKTKKQKKLT
jgi:hypothetical protein